MTPKTTVTTWCWYLGKKGGQMPPVLPLATPLHVHVSMFPYYFIEYGYPLRINSMTLPFVRKSTHVVSYRIINFVSGRGNHMSVLC